MLTMVSATLWVWLVRLIPEISVRYDVFIDFVCVSGRPEVTSAQLTMNSKFHLETTDGLEKHPELVLRCNTDFHLLEQQLFKTSFNTIKISQNVQKSIKSLFKQLMDPFRF